MSGFAWSARCQGCGRVSPSVEPGQQLVCNLANARMEIRLRAREPGAAGPHESLEWPTPETKALPSESRDHRVFVVASFGMPPSRFEPALVCPTCESQDFEVQWGGGGANSLQPLDELVAMAGFMLPWTAHRSAGAAQLLRIDDLPEPLGELAVSLDFATIPMTAGLGGHWYVEADSDALRACVVLGLRAHLGRRGCVDFSEQVVWSGTHLRHRFAR